MIEKHTPGRLRAGMNVVMAQDTPIIYLFTDEEFGSLVASLKTVPMSPTAEADARRLAACWNACEMVSTEDLEALTRPGDVSWACTIDRVVRERDELLTALGDCRDAMPDTTANINEAIAFPTSVPAYVRESIALLVAQRDELLAALREIANGDQVEIRYLIEATTRKLFGRWGAIAHAAISKADGSAASPQPAAELAVELYAGMGEPLFPVEPKSPESGGFDSNMGNSHITECQCKDRPASECPGAWEPGCSLGNSDAHAVAVVQHLPADDTEGGAA